jgi:formylglycine-generating enzyme required for sulfatase activity
LRWYRDDRDPGVHAAIDWLLRPGQEGTQPRKHAWGQAKELAKIDADLANRESPRAEGRWYVNGQGQTMVVLPGPGEFLMGSPEHEAGRYTRENLHRRRLGRNVAIASKKLTVAQFKRFLVAHPEVKHFYEEDYSPDADGPIVGVTWYEAAQYCRWLSEQENIPEDQMCYPSVAVIEAAKQTGRSLKLPADYLSRTGYRLPSEAEWEYACRADTRTSRYYGSSEELLGQHAWFQANAGSRAWPVGQKKPNGFGLLDALGNTWDWCQESGWPYQVGKGGKATGDEEDKRDITDELSRVLRGATFSDVPRGVRAAYRDDYRPAFRSSAVGLRVARTYR